MRTVALAFGVACLLAMPMAAQAQNMHSEMEHHPRIAKAIHELEDAIAYMEAAPHDFGGHKAAAIRDSRVALEQLRKALAYRERQDRR